MFFKKISTNNISIDAFNEKIEMYIPMHDVKYPPKIGDVEGKPFNCGCGQSHILDFEKHYLIADGGMFKAVFLSPVCGYLNALKLKKFLSSDIETLFSTKFLSKEPNYGFKSYPDFSQSVNMYKEYFG